ncbi:MAG: hypothetical protein ABIL09_19660 [Gemmatimonadota bacterium]
MVGELHPWRQSGDRWHRTCGDGDAWVEVYLAGAVAGDVDLYLWRGGSRSGVIWRWSYVPRRLTQAKRAATLALRRMGR